LELFSTIRIHIHTLFYRYFLLTFFIYFFLVYKAFLGYYYFFLKSKKKKKENFLGRKDLSSWFDTLASQALTTNGVFIVYFILLLANTHHERDFYNIFYLMLSEYPLYYSVRGECLRSKCIEPYYSVRGECLRSKCIEPYYSIRGDPSIQHTTCVTQPARRSCSSKL
jgi:hypothetical protein